MGYHKFLGECSKYKVQHERFIIMKFKDNNIEKEEII